MSERRSLWRRWRRLSDDDRRDVLSLTLLLPLIALSVRAIGVKRTRGWLLRRSARQFVGATAGGGTPLRAQRLAALAAGLGSYGRHETSCLRQALAVEYLLRRRGIPAELRVGTRVVDPDAFTAHAWVELDGVALGQGGLLQRPISGAAQRLQ